VSIEHYHITTNAYAAVLLFTGKVSLEEEDWKRLLHSFKRGSAEMAASAKSSQRQSLEMQFRTAMSFLRKKLKVRMVIPFFSLCNCFWISNPKGKLSGGIILIHVRTIINGSQHRTKLSFQSSVSHRNSWSTPDQHERHSLSWDIRTKNSISSFLVSQHFLPMAETHPF
jgi:hypothetical protein